MFDYRMFERLLAKLFRLPYVKQVYQRIILERIEHVCRSYGSLIAQFERVPRFCDPLPHLAFLRVIQKQLDTVIYIRNIPNVTPLNGYWFDKRTGWIVKLENIKALRQSKWVYIQYFWNRRRGKRYIFGLRADKRTYLLAILTHISSPISAQKHLETKLALRNVLQLLQSDKFNPYQSNLSRLRELLSNLTAQPRLSAELVYNQLSGFRFDTDLFPAYVNYYLLDKYALHYWQHPHDKIDWLHMFSRFVINQAPQFFITDLTRTPRA